MNLDQLATALVAAQAEFSAVPKTADNPFFKSKYADLATVVSHTQPILAKHGLAVSQFPTVVDNEPALITYLLHSSGQSLSHSMRLCAAKNDPQGQGAAITYARRFAYMAVLGLVADIDDDGNTANRRATQKSPADIARDELLAFVKANKLNPRKVAARFETDYCTTIPVADESVVRGFLSVLAEEQAVDEAADE